MGNEKILLARASIIHFLKTYERWVMAMVKYLGVVLILALISNKIGYVELLSKSYTILGIAFICMMLPSQFIMLVILAIVTMNLMTFSWILGCISLVVFIILYFGFIRLYPKESLLIVVTMAAFALKCQYLVPIIAALYCAYVGIFPIIIGIIGVYCNMALTVLMQNIGSSTELLVILEQVMETFKTAVLFNRNMLGCIIIFAIVFSIVYFIRIQSIDYAPYIAIVVWGVMNLLGFGLAHLFLKVQVDLGLLIGMSIASVIVTVLIQSFMNPLDYSRTETVQFEDEENVYYVKVVPKIGVRLTPKKVEQVYTTNTMQEEEVL